MNDKIKNNRLSEEAAEKYKNLQQNLKELGSVGVAFSSGVDSTLLLKVAHDVLGDQVVAITMKTHAIPESECLEAEEFCKMQGIRHVVLSVDEMQIPGFRENPKDRCYHCKKAIFTSILAKAEELGLAWVVEGSNMDDIGDYRPGARAIAELKVKSPLKEAGLYKEEIREILKMYDLPAWKKPAYACLASRIPYGEEITVEKLQKVEKAEAYLIQHGFEQMRVRIHGNIARIEVLPDQITQLVDLREEVVAEFEKIGFAYISMDLKGYRMGSMNEVLK